MQQTISKTSLVKNKIRKQKLLRLDISREVSLYKSLVQYAIKKGNKFKIENNIRTMLFYIAKTPKLKQKYPFWKITRTVRFTTPSFGITTRRKGSKNVYKPLLIKKSRGKYLSANWIISNAKLKSNKIFYKNLAEEIIDSALKKSQSFKQRLSLQKLAIANHDFKTSKQSFKEDSNKNIKPAFLAQLDRATAF